MIRKRCVVTVLVALSLLVGVGGPAVASEKLAALEKLTWEAWANNDAAAYGRLLAEGHIEIGSGGMTIGKDENIAGVESCDVRNYELGVITAQTLAEGIVVLTYEATQDATCNGIRVPKHVYCSSVWVERDGEWFIAMYHETPATE